MANVNEDDAKASTKLMEVVSSDSGDKSPKKHEAKEASGLTGVMQFLREVAIEHRKITWPDRPQIIRETWSVIVLVAAITIMVLGIDWVLGHAVFGPLEHWAKMYGAGAGRG
ncbi:MAG: preprotein translocase subunit SecE [Candidatus Obscuribacter sp.]|jgi:preprotein translocase SecE subunit|nr:preprotein translocase subunit SecE [Candidatus Obscuribacter sp.]MBL0184506.1 preprotein translocase subunit SecE [Candidatus Obscuribacter sp.]MDQ5964431.1 Preprotein translocase subunit SecE [Cyanobacteriota bacterium erpe_2018_sw_39hr_WHONDRS-SW48-000098_B_bin.30]